VGAVLLIDDNPIQLMIRESILRGAGFSVQVATSAESATAALRSLGSKVSVIVTDHVMPGTTGADFVRKLRAEHNWVSVIVLSGMPEAAPEYDHLQVTFREKPLLPPELIELVRSAIEMGNNQRGAA